MKILNKKTLSDIQGVKVTSMDIHAPLLAVKAEPGQFIAVMAVEHGERIPLTIVDSIPGKGIITIIFQEVGLTTKLLGRLSVGDCLYSLVGPLGHPTQISNYGKVVLVGGGVGIAEIYPVAKAFKKAGNKVIIIIGARSKELLILEKELKAVSDELHIATDDGSYGKKGFVTELLQAVIARSKATKQSPSDDKILVYAVGPIPMMKSVSAVTKPAGIKTLVSLNALMVDATGMCGCCRVTVGNETKFSCVDGPDFDAHLVDWDELVKRSRIYIDKEKHICNLNKL